MKWDKVHSSPPRARNPAGAIIGENRALVTLIFNNTRTDLIEHQIYEGSWSSWL